MTTALRIDTSDLVARLLAHPLYAAVRDERALRTFLRAHVFCVWDFQCLLKALQRALTCVEVPWLPTADPQARRLINEIVLDEESDVAPGGGHLSHFELYRLAMADAGADADPIDGFLAALRGAQGVNGTHETAAGALAGALARTDLPAGVAAFTSASLAVALRAPPHRLAAAFAYGREDVIPAMFAQLVAQLAAREPARWARFRYYLERHVERDDAAHGPAARALVARLCGDDPLLWAEAQATAREALHARLRLWDALLADIEAAHAADAPAGAAGADDSVAGSAVARSASALVLLAALAAGLAGCSPETPQAAQAQAGAPQTAAAPAVPSEPPASAPADAPATPATTGMVLVPGGEFVMGSSDAHALPNESPPHPVRVDAFWIDAHPVTNAEFARFVEATGYLTTAERPVDWEELKLQVPPGTPRPDDALLQPGSLVFTPPDGPVPLSDLAGWWAWTNGASWRHPQGPGSDLQGKDDHPVVQVSFDDAVVYAAWAGKRLPTEAEWEYAARGGGPHTTYAWGDTMPDGPPLVNVYTGDFPYRDTAADGYAGTSPVTAFPPNGYGLHDMAGNVWQWTSDLYRADAHALAAAELARTGAPCCVNPRGPAQTHNPVRPVPGAVEHVIKGGSFLCHASYCESYRPTARRGTPSDTGSGHVGFRCALDAP